VEPSGKRKGTNTKKGCRTKQAGECSKSAARTLVALKETSQLRKRKKKKGSRLAMDTPDWMDRENGH